MCSMNKKQQSQAQKFHTAKAKDRSCGVPLPRANANEKTELQIKPPLQYQQNPHMFKESKPDKIYKTYMKKIWPFTEGQTEKLRK